jgi:DNA-binding response OmpR family regulator
MKILVVEDEDRIASFLEKGLSAQGFLVERAASGIAALSMGSDQDLTILDLGLPDVDGLDVLKHWRDTGNQVPVIILTARDKLDDRVRGLNLGADDYLPKPFAMDELLARVRARLRGRNSSPATLEAGGVRLDLLTREASVGGRMIDLPPREFELLEEFVRHPNQVLARERLLSHVWKLDFDPRSNLVDVYVGYLRRKVGEAFIETVRGAGYRFRVPPDPDYHSSSVGIAIV